MRILQNDSYGVAARRLGDAVCRDARSDALLRELEDIPQTSGEIHETPVAARPHAHDGVRRRI
jgi:hypothetical protein